MKKIVSLLLTLVVLVLCCGCNSTTVTTDTESWVEGGNVVTDSTNSNSKTESENDSNGNTINKVTDNNATNNNTTNNNTSSNGNSNNNTNSNANNTTSNSVIDNPLSVDLKGATITIYQGNTAFGSFQIKSADTKTTKSYDQMIQDLQKKLNCKFKVVNVTEEKLRSQVMASAAAGNALCNIITSRTQNIGYYLSAGVLADMTRISSMDLSKKYTNNLNMLEASALGGSKYAVCSENGERAWVTLYNKRILKELGYKDNYLYDLADSKKFNWSNVKTLAKKAMKDLDGKSGMSVEDQWGFLTVDETWPIINTIWSSGSGLLSRDKDGYLAYNMNDPKIAASTNLIYDMYTKDGFFCRKISNWQDRISAFAGGHSLFITMTLEHVKTVSSESADDFGLLPMPITDEATEYKTVLDWNADSIMILAGQSAKDQYNSGAVVQALLSECGKNTDVLINEYSNRYLCDEKSADNMKVAINATKADVAALYSNTNEGILSGTYRPIWDLIGGKISSVATRIDETEKATVNAIKEFNDRAKKNKS